MIGIKQLQLQKKSKYFKVDKLSPIVLFVYSRKEILEKTIIHLKKNDLARKSRLYIFLMAKSKNDKVLVDNVRKYIKK